MGKKQRGKTTSLSNTTDGDNPMDTFNLMLDSSDDEAPEEVTFEDSKARALRSMREALDTARREKELLKEKRRRRQELFLEQKKRKLLSADVLEKIDSAPSKKHQQCEGTAEEEQQQQQQQEEEDGKKTRMKKRMQSQKLKGNYTVTTATKERASASYQLQAAKDFVQSRLYGPGICRTTSHELLSLQNKKGKNKGAAVQFVKKNWASKEKAKAEKEKKRWVHKQPILS